jgi:putative endonuclease
MYYTYILHNNSTKKYYVGYTPDLRNRLREHLLGHVKSTKSNLHYQLAWYCGFPTREQALSFEKYLKSGSGVAFMKKRFLKS